VHAGKGKYPNNLIPVILPAYTACEDGTECFETSAHKIQTPGNDMIYLLTAIGLSPGGSSTHLHTNNTWNDTKQSINRTTQQLEECGPCRVLASYTLAFALQPRKKHGKTSHTVAASKNRPKERIQHLEQGESLKSKSVLILLIFVLIVSFLSKLIRLLVPVTLMHYYNTAAKHDG
jgi:Ca2+/H+ antiporter